MSAFLILSNLSLSTPDGRLLCPDLTLAFGQERTGIVGANGAGKSTLLDVLAGDHPALTRLGRVGALVQDWSDPSVMVPAALGIDRDLDRLARIEAGRTRIGDLDRADWALPARVAATFTRLSLPSDALERRIADLSGGQRTRLGLARLLLAQPDVILLDEPTNTLDAEGRALIRDLIARWRGGVVVVSHDRDLLESMDRIVELAPKGAVVHGGGWSGYAAARAARLAREAAALDAANRELAQTRREIRDREEKKARRDRMGRAVRDRGDQPKVLLDARADRADRTGGRDARLSDKLEQAAEAARDLAARHVAAKRDLRIDVAAAAARGVVLHVSGLIENRGNFTLGPLDLTLVAGEHVALIGPNGSGKSTLIAALVDRRGAANGPVAVLDQHVTLLDPDASILANLRRIHRTLTDNDAHAALARFAFRNTDADRQVVTLSGGETLRAGLAVILGGPVPPALIILDEPTNHLDIEAVEVLEAALGSYRGALLIVSHDTAFLHALRIDREVRLSRGQVVA